MEGTVNVYLPLNTYVSIYGFTNAGYSQQVTLTEESGSTHVLTGQGEHNTPMNPPTLAIQTPPTSNNPGMGYQITVKIEHFVGSWQPSKVISGRVSVMYFNEIVVVSEDSVDEDFNDAVVQFAWWTPPPFR